MARSDIDENKDYIMSKLSDGVSRFVICREFQCKYDTLKARLLLWGCLELKNQGRKGGSVEGRRIDAGAYLQINGKRIHTHDLKKKLIRDGYKDHSCEKCRLSEWMGVPIPIELDHINGNSYDNRLENLRILCPNCHAQTDTHAGKNIGSIKFCAHR